MKAYPSLFLHVQSQESRDQSSLMNSLEALVAVQTGVALVCSRQIKPQDIVFLTPYQAQKKLLKKFLKIIWKTFERKHNDEAHGKKLNISKTEIEQLRVFTVDSFQGQEADVIIFSCVRSNQQHNIGFLSNKQRLLVVLS